MTEIPSARDFIGDIQTKYNPDQNSPSGPKPSEIKVMEKLISETQGEMPEQKPGHVQVDATLGMEKKQMKVNPTFTKLYYQGVSCYEKGNFSESVDFFGKALKLNPKHKEAYRYLLKAFYFVRQKNRSIAM